jgi:hypothetical protein
LAGMNATTMETIPSSGSALKREMSISGNRVFVEALQRRSQRTRGRS